MQTLLHLPAHSRRPFAANVDVILAHDYLEIIPLHYKRGVAVEAHLAVTLPPPFRFTTPPFGKVLTVNLAGLRQERACDAVADQHKRYMVPLIHVPSRKGRTALCGAAEDSSVKLMASDS